MNISDFIGRQNDLESFIDCNFDKVQYDGFEKPVYFYKVDFINKTPCLKFCTMSIQQCWVKKIDTSYTFFIIIKSTADVQKKISARYGRWDVSGFITTQGTPVGGSHFIWRREHVNISVESYINIFRIPKYEMCELVIFGNMKPNQLMDRPEE